MTTENDVYTKLNEVFKKVKAYTDYRDKAAIIRGRLLNWAIQLELKMDEFLSFYLFGKNKKKMDDFSLVFLRNARLYDKQKSCESILSKMPKTRLVYQPATVAKYIDSIRKVRNDVAHEDIFSEKFKQLSVSEKEVDRFVQKAVYCIDYFDMVMEKKKIPASVKNPPKKASSNRRRVAK